MKSPSLTHTDFCAFPIPVKLLNMRGVGGEGVQSRRLNKISDHYRKFLKDCRKSDCPLRIMHQTTHFKTA